MKGGRMKKIILTLCFLINFSILMAVEDFIPMLPLLPAIPTDKIDQGENGELIVRKLISSGILEVELTAEVIVPLEVISDVHIKALVVDNENLEIPFEVELNRKPEAAGIYRLNFSKTALDIDDDGVIDTEIFASKNIDNKKIKDNYIKITGKNISKEGTHKKRVYITVEVND
ncbi:hypothetical protein HMPREF0202_01123 [Cetobacterium somerae ATCC BAA-474]|uniref:Uncharacterized protein n=2 Tax=Cetobacterium TaxID=180162 RepID=U7VBR3_9FUSO|nr:hypothetical protein HMPREF0202_01123 [Cetobacterium somerae ATCC BAA-474]